MSTIGHLHEDTGSSGIADGESLVVDLSASGVSSAVLHQYSGDAAAEIYFEADPDGDGTYEISILVDSFGGQFHSEGNATRLSEPSLERVRIENTSGGTGQFVVTGRQSASAVPPQ